LNINNNTANNNNNQIFIAPYASYRGIKVSQANVATRLRCDGIFNDHFIANLLLSLTVKEF